jgi:hypothetical protein
MKTFRFITLVLLVTLLVAVCVSAQKREMLEGEELFEPRKIVTPKKGEDFPVGRLAALSAADVGEPDSFGKNVKFFGFASSGIVIFTTDCSEANVGILGPDDRCHLITDQNVVTGANDINLGRITIPGKSVDNVLHVISRGSYTYSMSNLGTVPSIARVGYVPSITLESVAFNDPSAIDPATGLPMNGSLRSTGTNLFSTTKMIAAGAFENVSQRSGSSSTLGFSREYFRQIGMSDAAINLFYKKPVTIKIGIRASTQLVSEAVFSYSIRLMGN